MCKIFYNETIQGQCYTITLKSYTSRSELYNMFHSVRLGTWNVLFLPLNSEWDMVLDYGPIHMRFFVFTVNLDPTLYVIWLAFISQDALS